MFYNMFVLLLFYPPCTGVCGGVVMVVDFKPLSPDPSGCVGLIPTWDFGLFHYE
jgi:hypothetical protein